MPIRFSRGAKQLGVRRLTTTVVTPRPPKYQEPKANITLPPNLDHKPTMKDAIVTLGFDGLTPEQGAAKIRSTLQTTVLKENERLIAQVADQTFHDFNVVLANTFLPDSPNQRLLKTLPANSQISLLGSMSQSHRAVYKIVNPATGNVRHIALDQTNNYDDVPPPSVVVMAARLRLDPPGLVMTYPNWSHSPLSQQIATILEI